MNLTTLSDFWSNPLTRQLSLLAFAWLIALMVRMRATTIARRLTSASRLARKNVRTERLETLRRLLASLITVMTFLLVALLALALFVPSSNIFWLVGLFGAGFGLGARPLVSDYLTGISYLVEDPYDVGEKVELFVPREVVGVVEEIDLRNTYLRASTGEIYTIPNGEIRVIRNFSRGLFSVADVILQIESADLPRALTLLDSLKQEAMSLLPNLLEPWQVISETGHMGQTVELKLLAKARYGKAAELRPRLLTLLQENFATAEITLTES